MFPSAAINTRDYLTSPACGRCLFCVGASSSDELELSLEDELESLEESEVTKLVVALSAMAATSGLSLRKILQSKDNYE